MPATRSATAATGWPATWKRCAPTSAWTAWICWGTRPRATWPRCTRLLTHQRVAHLILLTPGLRAVGIEEADEHWRAALALRSGEPWYPDALAAIEKSEAGDDSADNRRACMPFFYGRRDAAARAHVDAGISERSRPVRDGFAPQALSTQPPPAS